MDLENCSKTFEARFTGIDTLIYLETIDHFVVIKLKAIIAEDKPSKCVFSISFPVVLHPRENISLQWRRMITLIIQSLFTQAIARGADDLLSDHKMINEC